MKIKTHLKIIISMLLFFSIIAFSQEKLYPIKLNFEVDKNPIKYEIPSELINKNLKQQTVIIGKDGFKVCEHFNVTKKELIEKNVFISIKVNCTCDKYYLVRYTRYKLTNIYRLYQVDEPYQIIKKGNETTVVFKIFFDIARLNQKANILCKTHNENLYH